MEYTPHRFSDAATSAAVEVMFDLRGYEPEHPRERIVPDGRMHLVIELDDRPRYLYDRASGESIQECARAWLSGVHTRYITIGDTDQESRLLAVQFALGQSSPFTHRAASDFCDAVVPAAEVFGKGILDLRQALLQEKVAERRLALAESWLVDRWDAGWRSPPAVTEALTVLQAAPSDLKWTAWVAEHTEHSYKHFLSLFKRHVGPSPKVMQRVLRFAGVFQLLQTNEQVSWADVSADLGYSDQAHFVREFCAFSGYRPSQFLRDGHDRVNFFPEGARGRK